MTTPMPEQTPDAAPVTVEEAQFVRSRLDTGASEALGEPVWTQVSPIDEAKPLPTQANVANAADWLSALKVHDLAVGKIPYVRLPAVARDQLSDLLGVVAGRLAATPSDRARVDGEVTDSTDYKGLCDRALSARKAALKRALAAEQRALAAEARERAAIRQREISDRTAQDRRELADHNLRLAHEIEADLRAAEQRVRALMEGQDAMRQQGQREGWAAAQQWLRDRGAQKPRASLWDAASSLADQMDHVRQPGSALLPAADGRSGEG